jgi:hypothetical protein
VHVGERATRRRATRGVDPQRLRGGADIGDMRDRVEAIGGEFDATTAIGEGTVISGWVPARSAGGAFQSDSLVSPG